MIHYASTFAVTAVSAAMVLSLYRLVAGTTAADRILALDTLVINAIGLVVMMGVRFGTTMYFEAALLLAMIGFLSTVAFCKYLLRGNVIE